MEMSDASSGQVLTAKLISYSENSYEEQDVSTESSFLHLFREGKQHWLQICGLKDINRIENIVKEFDLSLLDSQIISNSRYPAKIEVLDDSIAIIFNAFTYLRKKIKRERVVIILKKDCIITIEDHHSKRFDSIAHSMENNLHRVRRKKPDLLLHLMLDDLTGSYSDAVNQIETSLENLEAELLNSRVEGHFGERIQRKKRDYMHLRKSVFPLKEQFSKLLRADEELISPENHPYFNDVNDQLQSIIHSLDACREMTSSLVDIYMSNNDLTMNRIMTQLTIVSTIFIPLTFLVGVWGMNFANMPELGWKYGYLAAWGVMVLSAAGIRIYFKRKKWC